MSNDTTTRWGFLEQTPRKTRITLDEIAQATLDSYREDAFPSSIQYPIVDPQGTRHGTLPAFQSSAYWDYLNAKVIYEHGAKCDVCDRTDTLRTLHLSYGHIGAEEQHPDELIVACAECHDYLRQQQRTGRRYGWRVQTLEDWLYTSKQERERRAARWMMEALHSDAEIIPSQPRTDTPPAKRFPLGDTPALAPMSGPDDMVLQIDGEIVILPDARYPR